MKAILEKELRDFFSSISTYFICAVFFLINALVLFVFKGNFNVYDRAVASLEAYFEWIPIVLLFVIPAICMRSFAEEKKSGTLELLLSRPISSIEVVMAKILAAFILVVVLLLPSILYKECLSALSSPVGNIDNAAFWGEFIGVLLLSFCIISISVFTSSLCKSQMIAFVSSVALSVFLYHGFDAISKIDFFGGIELFILSLGIKQHYESLSRGVIDIRDVVYYIVLSSIFIFSSTYKLRNIKQISRQKILAFASVIVLTLVCVNIWPLRLDLTMDKRYTLLKSSKEILSSTKEPMLFKVYLTGDLPANFKNFEKRIKETLDEFRIYAPSLRYMFVNVYEESEEKSDAIVQDLLSKGLQPSQIEINTRGEKSRRLVFPSAELICGEKSIPISLLQSQLDNTVDQSIKRSCENIEIQFINAIRFAFYPPKEKIAFLDSHGELSFQQTYSIGRELSLFYQTSRYSLSDTSFSIFNYDMLIEAQPKMAYSEEEKYLLDQYVMRGGKIIWLIDPSDASMDSIRKHESTNAMLYPLNLDDLWFRYGFRLNSKLLLDINSCPTPIITSYIGSQPVIEFIPNVYAPILIPVDSLCGSNVEPIAGSFVASIDSISREGISSYPLLVSSSSSREVSLPHAISADLMREHLSVEDFNSKEKTIALFIEGEFESAYKSRRPNIWEKIGFEAKSKPNSMAVIADGDLIRNNWDYRRGESYPVAYDQYTQRSYGNKDFFVNLVHKMLGNTSWIEIKTREDIWRVLDLSSVEREKQKWNTINIVLPLLLLSIIYMLAIYMRRKNFR